MPLFVASGGTAKHAAKLLHAGSQARLHGALHLLQHSPLFRSNRDRVQNAVHLIPSDIEQPPATLSRGAEHADTGNHNAQQRQRG
jgi:hypothetical protein